MRFRFRLLHAPCNTQPADGSAFSRGTGCAEDVTLVTDLDDPERSVIVRCDVVTAMRLYEFVRGALCRHRWSEDHPAVPTHCIDCGREQ